MNTNNLSLLSINFTKTTSSSSFPLHLSLTVSFPACVFFSLLQFPIIFTWQWSVVTLRMSTHPVMVLCSTKFPLGVDKLCLSFQVRGEEGDIDFWVTEGGSKAPRKTVSDLGDNLEVVIFRDETCVHTGGCFQLLLCMMCGEISLSVFFSQCVHMITAGNNSSTDAGELCLGFGKVSREMCGWSRSMVSLSVWISKCRDVFH